MAYTINRYNGTILTTVADCTVDTSTDLTFIGKNYAGYGEKQNENFLYLVRILNHKLFRIFIFKYFKIKSILNKLVYKF